MRVKIVGDCEAAKLLRGFLLNASTLSVVESEADWTVRVHAHDGHATVEGAEGRLEADIARDLGELVGQVHIVRTGRGLAHEVDVRIPHGNEFNGARAIFRGLTRNPQPIVHAAVLEVQPPTPPEPPKPTPWWKKRLWMLLFVLLPASLQAQGVALVKCHDGTTAFFCGDAANTALRVNLVAASGSNFSFNLNQYGGTSTTLGQKAMTASIPVVIASDQIYGANVTSSGTLSTACADPCITANETATNTVRISTAGLAGFDIVLQSGSLQGTLKFEDSADNITWNVMTVVGGGATLLDRNTTITNPGSGTYLTPLNLLVSGPVAGAQYIRVRIATISSGTPNLAVFIGGSSRLDLYSINLPGQGWEGTQRPTRFNIIGGVDETTSCNGAACNRTTIMANTTPTTTDYGMVVRDVQIAANTSVVTTAAPLGGFQVFGRDTSTACSSGPCTRGFNMLNTTPVGTEYGLIVRSTDGKAEDAPAVSGDVGSMQLGVRNDGSGTITTSANGDYAQFSVDAYGAQYVRTDNPNRVQCRLTTSATGSTVTSCAAPGASLAYYITDWHVYGGVAVGATAAVTLQSGTGGSCGTGTVINGYCQHGATAGCDETYLTAVRAVTNGEICLLDATVGTKFVIVNGFIAP